MGNKFSIIDDESNKILGFCKEVGGLQNELPNPDYDASSKLILYGFTVSEAFIKIPTIKLLNLHLDFLSRDGTRLGGYYFCPNKVLKINRLEISQDTPIEIVGKFLESPLPFAYEIWKKLRDNPNELGQWKTSTLEEKQGWLQVIRLKDRKIHTIRKNQVVTIDGEFIQHIESFFIAIGEAVNGPFGYYGANLQSFKDYLSGGFGLIPPFIIEWRNFHKSFEAGLEEHAEFVFLLLKMLAYRKVKVVYL
ncbi:barstar family protein [Paenibacillus rigui]|uniref:Barstar (barnase inhibitor) domain-containing protein n=1 Tax=Paenibacillus rigui TaxID=554312 RepID=A0A229UQI2_9BACL|nr:barstar family protein [Paenibacillus rigui]OXM85817.1 hypothetical protein CF651_11305 [Paenibacillus rigui]